MDAAVRPVQAPILAPLVVANPLAARDGTGALRQPGGRGSAEASGVVGTPRFFVNGRRHERRDIATLTAAVHAARERALFEREAA